MKKEETTFTTEKCNPRIQHARALHRQDSYFCSNVFVSFVEAMCFLSAFIVMIRICNQIADYFGACIAAYFIAFALNGPLVIAGTCLREAADGRRDKKEAFKIFILSVGIVLVAWRISFKLVIAVYDMSMATGETAGVVWSMVTEETAGVVCQSALPIARKLIPAAESFYGVLPLVTSLISFMVSYAAGSPLKRDKAAQLPEMETMLEGKALLPLEARIWKDRLTHRLYK